MQVIICDTLEAFYLTTKQLTMDGITFTATTSDLTIKLTGGY